MHSVLFYIYKINFSVRNKTKFLVYWLSIILVFNGLFKKLRKKNYSNIFIGIIHLCPWVLQNITINDHFTIVYYNINSLENTKPYTNLEFKCLKWLIGKIYSVIIIHVVIFFLVYSSLGIRIIWLSINNVINLY